MTQKLHKNRSMLIQEKMEKIGWLFLSWRRCFLLLLSLILGWILLFFQFMVLSPPHDEGSSWASTFSSRGSFMSLPFLQSQREFLHASPLPIPHKELADFSPATKYLWQPLKRFGTKNDTCAGKYVFMHDIPEEFNQEMLDKCRNLSLWTNMCKYTANAGLGPPLEDSEGSFSLSGWFATNQFAVEVIFHNRMKQYSCLTNDSSKAAAFFVPFYAGLDISRYLWGHNTTIRDYDSLAMAAWLQNRPEWSIMRGRDHFMVAGRITWDFRRKTDKNSDWGNKLLLIPAVKNMTVLVIEASPWHHNDFAIPYPTYFHPSHDAEVLEWQERMKSTKRIALFSFAGAPRPEIETSIRGHIMEQCRQSIHCKLLECDFGESKCHVPSVVMKLFEESVFCLQPQGDSFTRRSIFDSMLAGCIPVFFHPHSAYTQYIWHLPSNHSRYSVYIPEKDIRRRNISIQDVLLQISPQKVQSMREAVIKLIPGIVYANPESQLETMNDAFDVTVQAVVDRITDLRMRLLEGRQIEDFEDSDENDGLKAEKESVSVIEETTRHWEGQRRKGEQEGMYSEKNEANGSDTKPSNENEKSVTLGTLEDIWKRDKLEKEAKRQEKIL